MAPALAYGAVWRVYGGAAFLALVSVRGSCLCIMYIYTRGKHVSRARVRVLCGVIGAAAGPVVRSGRPGAGRNRRNRENARAPRRAQSPHLTKPIYQGLTVEALFYDGLVFFQIIKPIYQGLTSYERHRPPKEPATGRRE